MAQVQSVASSRFASVVEAAEEVATHSNSQLARESSQQAWPALAHSSYSGTG